MILISTNSDGISTLLIEIEGEEKGPLVDTRRREKWLKRWGRLLCIYFKHFYFSVFSCMDIDASIIKMNMAQITCYL